MFYHYFESSKRIFVEIDKKLIKRQIQFKKWFELLRWIVKH